MSSRHSRLRDVAVRLATHAAKALPPGRADWSQAMQSEIHHIPHSRTALAWAFGCVLASYTERMRTMISGNPGISRWVLIAEMLCCFTPLTLVCLAVVENLGRMQGAAGILALTVTAAGPVGLIVAFKVVVLSRPLLTRLVAAGLCGLAAWVVLAYSLQLLPGGQPVGHWREFVLIALLPASGFGHLLHLASHSDSRVAAA
jgi:uncharacterized membrane protein YhdT